MRELVKVGRVGKPHGLDGSFFVEHASEEAERFAKGAMLHVDGEPAEIVASKRSRGRPVIRLDREPPRGAELAVPRDHGHDPCKLLIVDQLPHLAVQPAQPLGGEAHRFGLSGR